MQLTPEDRIGRRIAELMGSDPTLSGDITARLAFARGLALERRRHAAVVSEEHVLALVPWWLRNMWSAVCGLILLGAVAATASGEFDSAPAATGTSPGWSYHEMAESSNFNLSEQFP